MEGREKLHTISDGLKVLQDRRAGRVICARVKNLTCKLNFAILNLAVRQQPRKSRKFVDRENFPSYGRIHGKSLNDICIRVKFQ